MAFKVYGMTEHHALLSARRTLEPKYGEDPEEFEKRVREKADQIMERKNVVALSGDFDAPSSAKSG